MGAGDGTRAVVVALFGESEVVLGRLEGAPPDLVLVGALARLHLEAHRLGGAIRLREISPDLAALLDQVGLAGLLTGRSP